jgi:hypothetical protein
MNIKLSESLLAALGNPANAAEARTALDTALVDLRSQVDACQTDLNAKLADITSQIEATATAATEARASADEANTAAGEAKAGIDALVSDSDKVRNVAEAAASTIAGQALSATGNTTFARTDDGAEGATAGTPDPSELQAALDAKDFQKAYGLSETARAEFDTPEAFGAYMRAVDAGRVVPFTVK